MYNAWLRSGYYNYAYYAYNLNSSGGDDAYNAYRRFAVRPRFTCLRKIYCRQFPNSARLRTTEQIKL